MVSQITSDPQGLCIGTVADHQEENMGKVKRIQYSIMGQDGYCSWIIPLNGYSATSNTMITFWIRGEKGGEQYEVGLKDTDTRSGREPKVPETASADWARVSIPLDEFKDQDLSSLENFSLNFKKGNGVVYVSQLMFIP